MIWDQEHVLGDDDFITSSCDEVEILYELMETDPIIIDPSYKYIGALFESGYHPTRVIGKSFHSVYQKDLFLEPNHEGNEPFVPIFIDKKSGALLAVGRSSTFPNSLDACIRFPNGTQLALPPALLYEVLQDSGFESDEIFTALKKLTKLKITETQEDLSQGRS